MRGIISTQWYFYNNQDKGFPGGPVVESQPASVGARGSIPGLGGSHMPRVPDLCAATTEDCVLESVFCKEKPPQ